MEVGECAKANKIIEKNSSSLSIASWLCDTRNPLFVVSEHALQRTSRPRISWEREKKRLERGRKENTIKL